MSLFFFICVISALLVDLSYWRVQCAPSSTDDVNVAAKSASDDIQDLEETWANNNTMGGRDFLDVIGQTGLRLEKADR